MSAEEAISTVIRRLLPRIIVLCCALFAAGASAQQIDRVRLIGRLAVEGNVADPVQDALRAGMRELGYVEGRDYRIEHRNAEGHIDRLPSLAQELVQLNVAVIVTGTGVATRAAQRATTTIPIVALLPEDPIASGFIDSFNRPGGNITGLTVRNTQLTAKRLELLKEILPDLSRVAVISDPSVRGEVEGIRTAARVLGIQIQLVEMKEPYDFDGAFKTCKRQRVGAVMLLSSPEVYINRARLGALALEYKLPTDSSFHDLARAGGLMAYSTDVKEAFHRTAYFVDRLFKGAKAGDLPFEQISNPRLTINLKTAKALGINIPEAVLVRADEVIR